MCPDVDLAWGQSRRIRRWDRDRGEVGAGVGKLWGVLNNRALEEFCCGVCTSPLLVSNKSLGVGQAEHTGYHRNDR